MVQFLAVSGVATACDFLTVVTVRSFLHWAWLPSVAAGFAVNVSVGYLSHRSVTFGDRPTKFGRSTARYLLVAAINLAVGVGGVAYVTDRGVPYVVTRAVSSIVLVAFNFVVAHWVFSRAPDLAEPA